ncbi:MAG TPA: dTDP-4-dehydrorhamnose 3,5-epimerase [Polyangiaceae bacterium]|jgi:dTDP-4-dehydrorhamnose 3,5-epimerase|nr:dTDP-4-dehydrorhamnose 3,5-epimerase [Polyangiaceae bacterium]
MRFDQTELAGAYVIEVEPHEDERGFFARAFCAREFAEHGLPSVFPQSNLSRNHSRGTLRGMHFEAPPSAESKLVRCVTGAIYDVIVDLRPSSASFLSWVGAELSAENARALFVPAGFAHGFITLTDDSDVFYQMGDFFRPGGARGARWNDPRFGIRWPLEPKVISERDATYADFDPAALGIR